jgi:hypothetical protein
VLDEEVLAQAAARAASTFDTRSIRAGARKLGAPIQPSRADHLARALLAEMAGGADPSPGLGRLLARALAESGVRDGDAGDGADVGDLGDLAQWIDAPDDARARALEDLLGLADAIPSRRRPDDLRFPRLVSASVG